MSSRLEQAIARLDKAVGAVEAAKASDSGANLGGAIAEIRQLIDDAMAILAPNIEDKSDGK